MHPVHEPALPATVIVPPSISSPRCIPASPSMIILPVDIPAPILRIFPASPLILITVSSDERVIHARRIMVDHNIARLPVFKDGKLVGIISDNEIAFALANLKSSYPLGRQKHQLEELLVHDAMSSPAITISKTRTVTDAAKKMIKHHVGCLPVVQNQKILGIVTRTDLLRTIKL